MIRGTGTGQRRRGVVAAVLVLGLYSAGWALRSAQAQVVNRPPTVTCPTTLTVECGTNTVVAAQLRDEDGNALRVTWTVDGNLDSTVDVPGGAPQPTVATVSLSRLLGPGPHTVVISVTDSVAPAVICTTAVNVVDRTPPQVRCSLAVSTLWPPNHQMVNVGLGAVVTDACDPTPQIQVLTYSNQDDFALGSGNFGPDAAGMAPGVLSLRSERSGNVKVGRVYLIIVKATDDAGNVGFDCCTVVVPHDQSARSAAEVRALAAAAHLACRTNATVPGGFFLVGEGGIIPPAPVPPAPVPPRPGPPGGGVVPPKPPKSPKPPKPPKAPKPPKPSKPPKQGGNGNGNGHR